MNITPTDNNYAGNVSESVVNFVFSAEKQEITVENTGQSVLEFSINNQNYEIFSGKSQNYNGYFTTCSLRSKKDLGTYSITTVDSLKADYAKQLLLNDDVEGTTQTNTLNPDETPSKVQHIDGNNNIIREDVYSYTDTAITCVRTIVATGQHVTVTENLTSPYNKVVGQVIG